MAIQPQTPTPDHIAIGICELAFCLNPQCPQWRKIYECNSVPRSFRDYILCFQSSVWQLIYCWMNEWMNECIPAYLSWWFKTLGCILTDSGKNLTQICQIFSAICDFGLIQQRWSSSLGLQDWYNPPKAKGNSPSSIICLLKQDLKIFYFPPINPQQTNS